MEIGLIQIDGDMPNLALMKISAWHKKQKDNVTLMKSNVVSQRLIKFDKVYISCIFEENNLRAKQLSKQFDNFELGGIGVNHNKLPYEIEHIMPDYDIYKCDYSMGFTTRGCIRNCEFCLVPKHEGMIKANTDIYEFWDKRHKHLVLLDNNILAHPKQFKKIVSQIKKEDLSVDFNQGLDIRLLREENIKLLKSIKVKPYLRFAFDKPEIENEVIKGLELLKKYKINGSMWYILVGFNTTREQDFRRLSILKKYKQKPYVMRYNKCRGDLFYNDLSAWANQQQFFASMDFETFVKCRRDRRELILNLSKKIGKKQKKLPIFE